jgi:hypothetical protein
MVVFPNVTRCPLLSSRGLPSLSRTLPKKEKLKMNAPLSPSALINPFALPSCVTLADVAEQVAQSSLSPTRQRDCLSALRRVADLLEQDLSALPADVGHLRERLTALNPANFGLSAHTWSNLRSNLFCAIEASGLQPVLRTARTSLAEPWRELFTHIPDRRTRDGLSRFARFCSLNGIPPQKVDLGTLQAFGAAVRNSTLARKAAMLERDVATLWNRLIDRASRMISRGSICRTAALLPSGCPGRTCRRASARMSMTTSPGRPARIRLPLIRAPVLSRPALSGCGGSSSSPP